VQSLLNIEQKFKTMIHANTDLTGNVPGKSNIWTH